MDLAIMALDAARAAGGKRIRGLGGLTPLDDWTLPAWCGNHNFAAFRPERSDLDTRLGVIRLWRGTSGYASEFPVY